MTPLSSAIGLAGNTVVLRAIEEQMTQQLLIPIEKRLDSSYLKGQLDEAVRTQVWI